VTPRARAIIVISERLVYAGPYLSKVNDVNHVRLKWAGKPSLTMNVVDVADVVRVPAGHLKLFSDDY
jgi:hypothetical protein